MPDIVVTVPKSFRYDGAPGKVGLAAWISEGDAAGDEYSGQEWWFTTYGTIPNVQPGERVYVVCEGRLRGYSPMLRCMYDQARFRNGTAPIAFVRGGGAVAVTIPEPITGFRGWRYRWWERSIEVPFPEWQQGEQKAAKELGRQRLLIGE